MNYFGGILLKALLGGIMMGMTTAPIGAWFLAWIALVPLWILIVRESNYSVNYQARKTILSRFFSPPIFIGLAWGLGYHGLALFWITGIHPMTWMGVPWLASLAIAIFCWLFISFWGAALVAIWSWGMAFFNKPKAKIQKQKAYLINSLIRLIIGVALWCILENIWSRGPLWWSSLSYTQSPSNLAILQLSQLSGFSTITASIVLINGLIAEGILAFQFQQRKIKLLALAFWLLSLIILIGLHLSGFWLYNFPVTKFEENAIRVGIIQGNIPNEIKLYPVGWWKAIEGYTTGYRSLADEKVDIILTSETALPFLWKNLVSDSSFYSAILEKKVPAWIGAFGKQGNQWTNSIFTVTGTGKIYSRYDKVKLVPLGEYIPFEVILGRFIERLSPLDAHLAKGNPKQIFTTPFGRAIVGICYESAFSEHFRQQAAEGGEFIITASNNAHYSNSMPAQHHAQDVLRAIETDRWVARGTNTGYSAIIDPRGRTLWISGINTYELHSDRIYRRQTKTLYVKWGDWLTVVLLLLGISGWLAQFWINLKDS